MKILFVYCNIETNNIRHFPFGIGTLSSFLKRHGHETELLYLQKEMDRDEVLNFLGRSSPDIVGFSVVSMQWETVLRYARIIKSVFKIPVICGGPHPTFMPREVIEQEAVDMLCMGEGECALLDVMNRMETGGDLSTIPNIWVKNEEGQVFKNSIRQLVENLDDLPWPDRDLMPFQEVLDESRSEPIFITSRGCPYNCRFCSNSAIKTLYKGKGRYIRQRSPENVIQEIVHLRGKYRFDSLNFYDEAFGYNKKWIKHFCDLYATEVALPFGAFIRAESVDRDIFRVMAQAGLRLIYIGVESGNEQIRRSVMNRKMSNDTIIKACRDAQAEGIQVWTFNMVGVPGETVDTIKDTMELNRVINPHFASVSIYQPMPGTELYDHCRQNNYIVQKYATSLYNGSILNLPTISRQDLHKMFRDFQQLSQKMKREHEKKGDAIFLVDM